MFFQTTIPGAVLWAVTALILLNQSACHLCVCAAQESKPAPSVSTDPVLEELALSQTDIPEEDHLFSARNYALTTALGERHEFRYRLFVPAAYDPSQKYPLVLWFHGAGDGGNSNSRQLVYVEQCLQHWKDHRGGFPAFVLATQCPEGHRGWEAVLFGEQEFEPSLPEPLDNISLAKRILEETQGEYSIDPSKIYATGISSGGHATWTALFRYPELFAAAAPLSSNGMPNAAFAQISHIPVWTFNVQEDPLTSTQLVQATIDQLNAVGGYGMLTEAPPPGEVGASPLSVHNHDAWSTALYQYDVLGWLLEMERLDPDHPNLMHARWVTFRYRCLSWHAIKPYLPIAGLAALCLYAIRRESQRRSKSVACKK